LREESLIPLADSYKSLSVVSDFEVVSGVEAKTMFRLDSGGVVGRINVGDYQMADTFPDLTGS